LTQPEKATGMQSNAGGHATGAGRWKFSLSTWKSILNDREEQVFLLLTLLIGALVGLIVVAFIEITGRFGARLYPPDAAAWRRFLVPVSGSLVMGYLLYKYFPDARGSGVPQTKAALYAHGGFISFSTLLGKFLCTSVTLASGIPLGSGRASGAGGRRDRFGAGASTGVEAGKSEVATASWGGGGRGGGV